MAGKRAILSWVLYDWAYGAFTTLVSTFVFATWFTQAVAPDPATGAAQWAAAQAASGVVIALVSVPLGAIADRGGRRRVMLGAATALMVLATLGLWFVRPDPAFVPLALGLVMLATIAFEVATVFYNAMLPGLVRPTRLGRLSMLAWGAGYAGGLVALGTSLVVLIGPATPPFGLDRAAGEPVRATAVLAGLWVAAFAWPCVAFVPEAAARRPWRAAAREGLAELRAVLGDLVHLTPLRRFIIARLFYMDGLITLFAFGGIYAAGAFGFGPKQVLIFGIALNVTAGLGAAGFALIEDRIGARASVLVSLAGLCALGTAVLLVYDPRWFWGLGVALGLFVGPAQAASRSMMAHMAPAEARAAWFGLFALSGRVTAFLGPAALGIVTALSGSQRAGMSVIVVLLALGALLLARVPSPLADR